MSIFSSSLRAKRWRVFIFAGICLALLAYIDYFTGPSVSVTCFYLIPVFFLSWYGGWRVGLLVALLHASVWYIIDRTWLPDHSPIVIYWNFAVRFITFAAVVGLVHM